MMPLRSSVRRLLVLHMFGCMIAATVVSGDSYDYYDYMNDTGFTDEYLDYVYDYLVRCFKIVLK